MTRDRDDTVPMIPPTLPEERELLRGPLSKNAYFRLIVTGNFGSKEIDNLIKFCEVQRDILLDDGA